MNDAQSSFVEGYIAMLDDVEDNEMSDADVVWLFVHYSAMHLTSPSGLRGRREALRDVMKERHIGPYTLVSPFSTWARR